MKTRFQISPIPAGAFAHLLHLNADELTKQRAVRQQVTAYPGFPCRYSLEDAPIGEEVILFPYLHQEADSPYRSFGPVYVRPGAPAAQLAINGIPEMVTKREQSLRAYDKAGMMIAACVTAGPETEEALHQLFSNPEVVEVHLHNAKPGCFNCKAVRVTET